MLGLLGVVASATVAAPVLAGIADKPLPLLNGGKSQHVYSVPGVIKLGVFETLFMCTSAETEETIRVGVEVFDDAGGNPANDVGAGEGAIDVGPGETVTIATGNTAAFVEDTIIPLNVNMSGGSARIVSTSKKIICTAMLVDLIGAPPGSMIWRGTCARHARC